MTFGSILSSPLCLYLCFFLGSGLGEGSGAGRASTVVAKTIMIVAASAIIENGLLPTRSFMIGTWGVLWWCEFGFGGLGVFVDRNYGFKEIYCNGS